MTMLFYFKTCVRKSILWCSAAICLAYCCRCFPDSYWALSFWLARFAFAWSSSSILSAASFIRSVCLLFACDFFYSSVCLRKSRIVYSRPTMLWWAARLDFSASITFCFIILFWSFYTLRSSSSWLILVGKASLFSWASKALLCNAYTCLRLRTSSIRAVFFYSLSLNFSSTIVIPL